MLYCDLVLNGVQAWSGVPCLLGTPINSRAYLGFTGSLLFIDTQGTSDPDYTGLGTRYFLIYVPADGSTNTVVPLTMEPSQQVSITLGLQDCLLSFYDRDTLTSPTDRAAFVPAAPARGFQSPTVVVGPPGPQGKQGLQGPIGVQGVQGIQGVQGNPGANGNTVLYGSGIPSSSLGVDGNFYVDTVAYYFYGPKAAGVWPSGIALKSPGALAYGPDVPPAVPDAWNDEFNSDTGPTGTGAWNWVNQGTATYWIAGGALAIHAPNLTTDSLRILVKPWSDVGAWTITAKVSLLANGLTDFTQCGLVLRNSTSGKMLNLILTSYSSYASGLAIQFNTYNSPTSYASNVGTVAVSGQEFYLRIQSDGTNLTAFYSVDGINFINCGATTIAAWLGSIDGVGFYANSVNSSGLSVTGSFDWIRKNWTPTAVSMVSAGNAYSSVVLGDRPVAYWRFNDDYSSTTYKDSSGNGYDATPVGGHMLPAVGGIAGDPDRGMEYADGQYATIPVGLQTAWPNGNSFTIEGLFKVVVGSTYGSLFEISSAPNSTTNLIGVRLFNTGPFTPIFSILGAGTAVCPHTLVGTQWYHIVATYDGATMKLYLDGSLVASTAVAYTIPLVSRPAGGILTTAWNDPNAPGIVDELALYNSCLSAAQVANHYAALVKGASAVGNTVLSGTVNPTSANGVDGDFWINAATNYIFGPKTAGVWPAGVSLISQSGLIGKAKFSASGGVISNLSFSGAISGVTRLATGQYSVTLTGQVDSNYSVSCIVSDDGVQASGCSLSGTWSNYTNTGFVVQAIGFVTTGSVAVARDPGLVVISVFR